MIQFFHSQHIYILMNSVMYNLHLLAKCYTFLTKHGSVRIAWYQAKYVEIIL
jgi:hypothetical protein